MKKFSILYFIFSFSYILGYQSDVHPYISKQAFQLLANYFLLINNTELASQMGNIDAFVINSK